MKEQVAAWMAIDFFTARLPKKSAALPCHIVRSVRNFAMFDPQFCTPGFLARTAAAEKAQEPESAAPKGTDLFELSAEDLPAVCPHASMPLWASHPRVYLDVVNESEAMCPYCGTRYRLSRDTRVQDHQWGGRSLHQHRKHGVESENRQSGLARASGNHEPQFANLSADALGNTTLELMTRWLRGSRSWPLGIA